MFPFADHMEKGGAADDVSGAADRVPPPEDDNQQQQQQQEEQQEQEEQEEQENHQMADNDETFERDDDQDQEQQQQQQQQQQQEQQQQQIESPSSSADVNPVNLSNKTNAAVVAAAAVDVVHQAVEAAAVASSIGVQQQVRTITLMAEYRSQEEAERYLSMIQNSSQQQQQQQHHHQHQHQHNQLHHNHHHHHQLHHHQHQQQQQLNQLVADSVDDNSEAAVVVLGAASASASELDRREFYGHYDASASASMQQGDAGKDVADAGHNVVPVQLEQPDGSTTEAYMIMDDVDGVGGGNSHSGYLGGRLATFQMTLARQVDLDPAPGALGHHLSSASSSSAHGGLHGEHQPAGAQAIVYGNLTARGCVMRSDLYNRGEIQESYDPGE